MNKIIPEIPDIPVNKKKLFEYCNCPSEWGSWAVYAKIIFLLDFFPKFTPPSFHKVVPSNFLLLHNRLANKRGSIVVWYIDWVVTSPLPQNIQESDCESRRTLFCFWFFSKLNVDFGKIKFLCFLVGANKNMGWFFNEGGGIKSHLRGDTRAKWAWLENLQAVRECTLKKKSSGP